MQVEVRHSFFGNNREALYCREPEYMLAGPADTGKTITCLTRLHLLAYKYSNASLVIARKQLTDVYSTVLQTYQKKILTEDDPVKPFGGEKPQWFDYPNGSRIWVAGLDKPGKVLSAEHDCIYINQAEEMSLSDWETCTTRTTGRAGNMPYAQTFGDCNPRSPMHWIISRSKMGYLKKIDSTHQDNPELYDQKTGELTEQGKIRIGRLKKLTGNRKQRLLYGIWAAPEGAIYTAYDDNKHKCVHFDIPKLWPAIVAIDPIGAVTAALGLAFDPGDQKLHVFEEYRGEFGISIPEHAKKILVMFDNNRIFAWVGGGPSENQARLDFQNAGIPLLEPPNVGVWGGIDRVIQLLEHDNIVIHDNCISLQSEIGDYQRKIGRDGIVTDTIENKETFHFLDALRYGVTWLTSAYDQFEQVNYNPIKISQY